VILQFAVGFNRLMGKCCLFPFGLHCTGMPVKVIVLFSFLFLALMLRIGDMIRCTNNHFSPKTMILLVAGVTVCCILQFPYSFISYKEYHLRSCISECYLSFSLVIKENSTHKTVIDHCPEIKDVRWITLSSRIIFDEVLLAMLMYHINVVAPLHSLSRRYRNHFRIVLYCIVLLSGMRRQTQDGNGRLWISTDLP